MHDVNLWPGHVHTCGMCTYKQHAHSKKKIKNNPNNCVCNSVMGHTTLFVSIWLLPQLDYEPISKDYVALALRIIKSSRNKGWEYRTSICEGTLASGIHISGGQTSLNPLAGLAAQKSHL